MCYNIGCRYIRDKFSDLNANKSERQIYSHTTNASDQNNIEKVFGDVQHMVIMHCLKKSMYMIYVFYFL